MRRVWSSLIAVLVSVLALSTTAQAQGTLAPLARIQMFTNTGAVCASCELNVYTTGTSTRATTYSESTLTTANANPAILDSAGRAVVYLSPGTSYRFVLTNSGGGTTYWDTDPVQAVPSSSGNLDITGTAGEALVLGDVVWLSEGSGSTTAGRWYKVDADNTYSSSTAGMTGIATAAITAATSGTIRIAGRMTGLSGLTAGELYYASATAGALTATPPTNQRFIGEADTTTTLILGGGPGAVKLPDSDGTHTLAFITTSNLTADRRITIVSGDSNRELTISGDPTISQDYSATGTPGFNTVGVSDSNASHYLRVETTSDLTADRLLIFVPGDAARTVTLNGNPTLDDWFDQSVKTTATPLFGAALIFGSDAVVRRNTSDATDSGSVEINGGGATGSSRGGGMILNGNEHATLAGDIVGQVGNVSGAEFSINRADATESLELLGTDGSVTLTSSKATSSLIVNSTATNGSYIENQRSGTAILRLGDVLAYNASFAEGSDNNDAIVRADAGSLFLSAAEKIASVTAMADTTASAANMVIENDVVTGRIRRSTSSARYKRDIAPSAAGLAEILRLRPVTFMGIAASETWRHYGFLAEDMAQVMPNLVGYDDVDGKKMPGWIEYDYLSAPIVKAIQELHERVVQLERDNAALRAKLGL